MDAARHETNDVARGRRSRVVLTPRRWRLSSGEASFSGAMVARKPGHQGELGVSRKTIVQAMPGRFRRTCGDYRVLTTSCTRAAGATSTRHSLRPLISRDSIRASTWAQRAARARSCVGHLVVAHPSRRGEDAAPQDEVVLRGRRQSLMVRSAA
jgi:hypothetical protein